MDDLGLDRDFLRFRDRGSTDALARVFDAAAPRLLLIAGHLTRDAGRAEDLVQTTFLHAMRDARRYDGGRPVEAWLAGILRHRALDERRRAALRGHEPLDEASGELGSEHDPAKLVADAELYRRVVAAVRALEEPYRSVLNLRVVHGLAPTAIAHALGRRPATVRMQVKRGLAELRRAVPVSGAWVAFGEGARGLASVREAVLSSAAAASAPAPSSGAPSAGEAPAGLAAGGPSAVPPMKALATALGGVLTMKTMAGLLAAVALAVTLTWIARERAAEPLAAAAPAAAELARAPGDREPRALADAAPPAAEPRRAVADAAPPSLPIAPAELEVRVTFAADGAPAPDVGVYLRVAEGDARGDEQRTDAAGVTTFASLAPEVYEVHVDRVSTPARVRWPEASRVALAIPAGLRVEGRVVDLEDEGVAGAAVFRQNARHHDLLQRVAVTGAEGRFTLRDVEDDLELLARASRHQPSELETVRGTEVAEVELRLGARGHALGGRVLLPDGWPAAHAWVLAGVDEDAREEREGSDADPLRENRRKPLDREGILLRADADGRFASDEIPGGHVLLVARTAPGEGEDAALVGWTTQFVRGDMADELVVRLQPGASVAGRVRDRSGAPVAGVALEAEWEGTRELGQMEDDLGPFVSDRRAVSAQDGSYRLAGLLPGDYDLRVRGASEELAREERVLGLGEVVAWDPVIDAPGALDVHLAGPIGAPLAGWRVEASDRAVPGRTYADSARLRTDAEGRVRVPDLPAERDVTLAFFAPLGEGNAPLAAATRPGARPRREAEVEEVRVRLAPDEMPTASLVGRFRGSDGQPAERARIELRNPGSDEEWVAYTEPDGRFAFRPLAPGPVRLRAVTPELPAGHTLGTWTLATGEALDVGDLVAPSTAPFTVIVRAADGGSVGRLDLELLPLESPEGEAWARDALVGGWSREGDVFTALAPIGPAFLRASGGEFAAWYEPVHVGAGGPVDVRLERAAATTLRVRLADERETEALALRVRLWDERGLLVLDHEVWTFGRSRSHAIEVPLRVRPGSYRLRVDRRGSDERVERELLLPLAGTAQAIDVELR